MQTCFPFLLLIVITSGVFGADPKLFHPMYEGAYQVKMECQKEELNARCATLKNQTFSLVVINYFSEIRVVILSSKSLEPTYRFSATSFSEYGRVVDGNAFLYPEHPAREIRLEFNPGGLSKSVKGWIRDTNFVYDLRVNGVQKHSPGEVFVSTSNPNIPLGAGVIVGDYRGTVNGKSATLSIRKSATSEGYMARYQILGEPEAKDFYWSIRYPEEWVVSFYLAEAPNSFFPFHRELAKWSVKVEEADGGVRLQGTTLSSWHAYSYTLDFYRISDP